MGIQFFVIFLGLVLGGVALDSKLSTGPWFTLAGTALGGIAAFYTLYRAIYGNEKKRSQSTARLTPGHDRATDSE